MDINKLKEHEFIVLGYEHYTPLGAIRSLGENGIKPIVFMLPSDVRLVSKSKYIKKLYHVKNYEEAYQIIIKEYGNIKEKPFIIPCDDNIAELLDRRYDEIKDRFYVSNAGKPGRISNYMNKWTICELALKHGLYVAKSWVVKRGDVPKDLIYPIITKPLTSYPNWKADYRICESESELQKAYKEIKGQDILLQQYIKKTNELCLDGVVIDHGKQMFISIASKYTYTLPDYYSMEMVVENFRNEDLSNRLSAMFNEIGYEGIFSVEFMIDEEGKLWFLEINFRNSTWSYASTSLGMNLPLLWAYGMIEGKYPKDKEKEIPQNYIALAEIDDLAHRVRRLKMISFHQWVNGVKRANCLYYWNNNDKLPAIVYWKDKIIRVIKKKLHLHKELTHA